MTIKKILAWVCVIVTYIPLIITALAFTIFWLIFVGLVSLIVKVVYSAGYTDAALYYAKMMKW